MISSEQRKCMIEPCCPFLSISTQCQLLTLTRSSFYYIPSGESEENLAIIRQLDEQYFSPRFMVFYDLLPYNIFIERLWRSVKYENVYLNLYENGLSLWKGLDQYFQFYNHERLHQSLDYHTPNQNYVLAA